MDINKLKVPELRKELKIRGLSTGGNKNELLDRLQSAMKRDTTDDAGESGSNDDLEEDLLNEEDDESHIEENDAVLQDLDSTLDKSPLEEKLAQGTKHKSDEGTQNSSAIKKIILNRAIAAEDREEANGGTADVQPASGIENKEKKVIKLSELSTKERLEMRAKKFGTALTLEAKKEVRAERFGIPKTPALTSNTIASKPATPVSADVLKQRAERFGVKTSATLTKIENQEKLDKRKARFGITNPSIGPPVGSLSKAQQRLERFKQPIK